jgi:hypothetical protein
MLATAIALTLLVAFLGYAMCALSGEISREEERAAAQFEYELSRKGANDNRMDLVS